MINNIKGLRFLTCVRNDIFSYYDTVSFFKGGRIGVRYSSSPFDKGGLREGGRSTLHPFKRGEQRILRNTFPLCKGGLRGISLGRGGFTLLEILIAIAIMSILLVAIYSTFLLAHKALFDVDRSLVKLQETRTFVDILEREIESALYSQANSYYIFKIDDRDFYGRQASSVTMTTASPLMKGLAKIKYAVEERDGILIITKSMASVIAKEAQENRMDILEDIESFTLQAKYRGAWVKTWDSSLSGSTPEEVKITVTMRMTDREGKERSAAPLSIFGMAKLRVGSVL